ncbi:MAG: hypothetical protein ACE37F_09685 [Nannocystaceae bacterium]|nr:hypothetical protein [bacterium]
MSAPSSDLVGDLPPPQPTSARPGTWTIRPDQALRWASVSAPQAPAAVATGGPIRALTVVLLVLVAGLVGGVGAWAIAP